MNARPSDPSTYGPYIGHPVAELFPLLDAKEMKALASDIEANGQNEPCVVWHGQLVDGRNRWRACELAGVEPAVVEREFADGAAVATWVSSTNLMRRHMKPAQRAAIGAELTRHLQAQRADGTRPTAGRARDEAAAIAGVSSRSIGTAMAVDERAIRPVRDAVVAGELAIAAAGEFAKLPVERQEAVWEEGGVEAVKQTAARMRTITNYQTSLTNEHYTPEWVIAAVRRVLGEIELDPASCERANEIVRAKRILTIADNGLKHLWSGLTFMNPPYGFDPESKESNQKVWLEKLHLEHSEGRVPAAISLVNAYTGNEWFELMWKMDAVCLPRRLHFLDSETLQPQRSPMRASAIGYLGPDVESFAREFLPFGHVVPAAVVRDWLDRILESMTVSA